MELDRGGGWRPLIRLCVALRFLTLIPVSWRGEEDGSHFPDSLPYFIVVGALIGGAVASLSGGLLIFFPQSVTAMLAIMMLAGISGFLHLDGLSDSADGLLSARSQDARLAIMKDSRAGAMGIVAVVLVLLSKYSALAAVRSELFLTTLLLMPMAGRCAILIMMAGLPYARQEGGIGGLFYSGNSKKAAVIAIAALGVSAAALAINHLVAIGIVLGCVVFSFSWWCRAKLGGATGDTLGAVCELAETAVAIAMAASLPIFFP